MPVIAHTNHNNYWDVSLLYVHFNSMLVCDTKDLFLVLVLLKLKTTAIEKVRQNDNKCNCIS